MAGLDSIVKEWIKLCLGQLSIRRLSKQPIVIFGTRRSGSTSLMRLFYSQPGTDYVDQPLDLGKPYHPRLNDLPHPTQRKFIILDRDMEAQLRDFLSDIFNGKLKWSNQWNILDLDYSFRVHQLVVKILNVNPLIDWFSGQFDIHPIYLVRHPVPVSLSIMKRGWADAALAYVTNRDFTRRFLDEAQLDFCRDVVDHGSPLERHVLEWGLENLYPLNYSETTTRFTLTYEELVHRPEQTCELLASWFDLHDPERMKARIGTPSKTAFEGSKEEIQKRGGTYPAKRWLNQVSNEDLQRVDAILTMLDISAYASDRPYPADGLLHFGCLSDERT